MTTFSLRHNRAGQIPVGPAIAPAVISRAPVFQPRFKNLDSETRECETAWAKVTVTGKLGEVHRKILDAIFAEHMRARELATGAKDFIIDPYKIEKLAGVDNNTKWLLQKLRELRFAEIVIEDKATGLRHWGSIVAEFWEVKRRAEMPTGKLAGPAGELETRPLLAVQISPDWMAIYDTSLVVRYKELLPVVNSIKSGAAHALALHMITHDSDTNVSLDRVLTTIGAFQPGMRQTSKRRIILDVLGYRDTLVDLGISFYNNDTMLHYSQPGRITVNTPHIGGNTPHIGGNTPHIGGELVITSIN